jgi:hypothetical protein
MLCGFRCCSKYWTDSSTDSWDIILRATFLLSYMSAEEDILGKVRVCKNWRSGSGYNRIPVSHNIRSDSCAFRPEPLTYNLGFRISL